MAWDRRNRSPSSRGGPAAMKELESSSSLIQPWACSSLSSSEKFLSLYDKMQEDREKKNSESPVGTRCLLQEAAPSEEKQFPALLPPTIMIEKPGSKIVFPHITSRGSLVGKKVYCRTSINNNFTWRQKNCTQRRRSSLMILNFYQDRSNNDMLAIKQTPPADSSDSVTASSSSSKQPDHSLDKRQCRILFLSLAGAAGMRLICPPLQLPLLEIVLFFRRQISSKNRGGLWRFPVNLALATLRPFTGALERRFLTALLCLAQMRIMKDITATDQQRLRYMPADLYSVVFEKEEHHHLDHNKELTTMSPANCFPIDDPVVTTKTKAADDVADRATTLNHHDTQFLPHLAAGRSYEEQCWSEECWSLSVPVVEILISERREDRLPDYVIPKLQVKQDQNTGSDIGTRLEEEFQFPLLDLKELERDKLVSLKPFPKQRCEEDLTTETVRTAESEIALALKRLRSSENGLVLSCKKLHVPSVEESRTELSSTQSEFAVSQPALQFRLEFATSSAAVKAASSLEENCGGVVVEEDSMTDKICVVAAGEEPREESRFVSQTAHHLEEAIDDELAEDDVLCSQRTNENICEWLQEPLEEVFQSHERTSAEYNLDEKAAATVPVRTLPITLTDVAVEIQPVKDIQEVTSTRNTEEKSAERYLYQELEVAERLSETVPVERLSKAVTGVVVENESVKDIQEVTSTLNTEEKSAERSLYQELEVAERLSETVPVERLSRAVTGVVVENEAVKDILEVKSTRFSEEKFARSALNQDLQVCYSKGQSIDDGSVVFLERLQGSTPVFLPERNGAEDELIEKGSPAANAVTGVLKNEASKEIQEMPTMESLSLDWTENGVLENESVKEIQEVESALVVDEENLKEHAILSQDVEVCPIDKHRIGGRETELLERVQSDVSLSDWANAENEREEESLAAAAEKFPVEIPSLALTEVFENESVKEIQEVKSTHSVEQRLAERVLDQQLEVGDSSPPAKEGKKGQEHDDFPSSPTTICAIADADDSHSENTSSEYNPCAKIAALSTHTTLTSRLNTATEADTKDGHGETEAKVRNIIDSDSTSAHDDSQLSPGPARTETFDATSVTTSVVSASDENCNLDESIRVRGDETCFPDECPIISPTEDISSRGENCGVQESYPEHPFADHPTCVENRERRHSHGDQTYIDMQDLLPPPWGQLIFWHGRCKEGRPTLCVLLGKAVRQLPNHELKHFIAVTVSHLEYAELNFFKGNTKQMNILMDLEGLGFMRLPPMNILSSIGYFLNRDYPGRGGWIMLVNAPVMLGFVISAIQGVIFNKGGVTDNSFKGFLEGKERIMMMGSKYRTMLQKQFDTSMLPAALGGQCTCCSDGKSCMLGSEFLKLSWNSSPHL